MARQDFFGQLPYDFVKNKCEEFWDNHFQIAEKAYQIWLTEGCPEGKDKIHWEKAKQEIV
jgi:hypothetical protein